MTPVVLRCGDVPLPLALTSVTALSAPAIPEKDDFEDVFAHTESVDDPRLIIVGDDAAFAATLTRLMRTDRLATEIAYVPESRTPATEAYGLRTGSKAASVALQGDAKSIPLIRDDAGVALVGRALVHGEEGSLVVRHTSTTPACSPARARHPDRTDSADAGTARSGRPGPMVRRLQVAHRQGRAARFSLRIPHPRRCPELSGAQTVDVLPPRDEVEAGALRRDLHARKSR